MSSLENNHTGEKSDNVNLLKTIQCQMEKVKATTERLMCPITREIMVDPVTAKDGHNYERSAIEAHLKNGPKNSPMNRNMTLEKSSLIPNHTMSAM